RVAGMGKEANERLVELDPFGILGSIRGDGALRALSGYGPGTIGQQKSDQGLESEEVSRLGCETEEGNVRHLGERALPKDFGRGDSAEPTRLVALRGHGCTDQCAEQPDPPRQALGGQPRD